MYTFANGGGTGGTRGAGGGGEQGQSTRAHTSLCTKPHTVEPQFNEVPREWGNFLVISKTSISRIFGKTLSKMFITCILRYS